MSIVKILGLTVIAAIAVLVFFNVSKETPLPQESEIAQEEIAASTESIDEVIPETIQEESASAESTPSSESATLASLSSDAELPNEVNRMQQLFQPYPPLLPIVETVSYSSKVSWVEGRAAYLGDYASYYQTSKHFIARSLKGVGHYLSEAVSKGDRFNVFKKDKEIEFHLVLDLSRLKLWAYYYDQQADEKVLLKTYPVCTGRLDSKKISGCLTPTGVFLLGKEIAVYKPGTIGLWRNEKREMVSIFGVRWVPFEKEIANCSGSCRGLGFQGVPWNRNEETQEYIENRECIGHYESGGCIRLLTEDIEELFAVVTSRPTFVHIVRDFQEAILPGKEKI